MNPASDSKYSFQITRGSETEQRGWQLRFFKNGKPVGKNLHAHHPADNYAMALEFAFEWLQEHSMEKDVQEELMMLN